MDEQEIEVETEKMSAEEKQRLNIKQ
jgi:pre-mRNA-splicing factor ATP-dependent RNA helicase DHX16